MDIKMHPKPMRRHTAHVQPAQCEVHTWLSQGEERVDLILTLPNGATQRICFDADAARSLEQQLRVAVAGFQTSPDR